MKVYINGEWREVVESRLGVNGGYRMLSVLNEIPPYRFVSVDFIVTDTFAPMIEINTGIVEWWENDNLLATGTQPSLTFGSGTHTVSMMAKYPDNTSALSEIRTINCGFNSDEDSGRYNLGVSYNWPTQPLLGLVGLQHTPNLQNLCLSKCPINSSLDCSTLDKLRFIECYQAHITSINLEGCTSLNRLCLEQTRISYLDLNPVSASLYDLRAANQRSVPSLTFAPIVGSMNSLYHYCVRDQTVINMIPQAKLPVLEEYWAWNTNQTSCDIPISPMARSYILYENGYDQASVDNILIGLSQNSTHGAYSRVNLQNSSIPSSAGLLAAQDLVSAGWTVEITNGE